MQVLWQIPMPIFSAFFPSLQVLAAFIVKVNQSQILMM
jgi:hypothetical protein